MAVKQAKIKTIATECEACRKLPDVYIGALGNSGFINMVREIFQNSCDCIAKGYTDDMNIILSYDENTHMVINEDNGPGIQMNDLVTVFSKLHSSSNYDKKEGSGQYSAGKNGMGATITNFLSKTFTVESYLIDGTAGKVEFKEGVITSKGLQKLSNKKCKHGLKTIFEPSSIMGEITVGVDEIRDLIWKIIHLCPIGTTCTYNSINKHGDMMSEKIVNKNGLYEIYDSISPNKNRLINPLYYIEDNGTMKVEVLFGYDLSMQETIVVNFANMCPTEGRSHVQGYTDALALYFRNYMNKIYLSGNKKLSVTSLDILTGLRAVVNVYLLKPSFTGQSKNILDTPEMVPFMKNATKNFLENWANTNPSDLSKLAKYFKDVCTIRSKQDDQRIKITSNYKASVISGLPSKLKAPNKWGSNTEIFIVEGDSAASGIENNRDKSFQGVFPIRGKMPNAFTTPRKKYLENEEVSGILHICGYKEFNKKLDPNQFRLDKLIIATDADADGAHIRQLFLGLPLLYMPEVVEMGKIYATEPPLFGVNLGKDNMIFFTDRKDYLAYVRDSFVKNNVIKSCASGTRYKSDTILKLILENDGYLEEMNKIAMDASLDPILLEALLYNYGLSKVKYKNAIKKLYPFINVEFDRSSIIIDGTANNGVRSVVINNEFLAECANVIAMINNSERYYNVNGHIYTLYQLLDLFRNSEPKNITRYKGLGEMPPRLLGKYVIIPGNGRILRRYTTQSIKEDIDFIQHVQSDKGIFIRNLSGKITKDDIL